MSKSGTQRESDEQVDPWPTQADHALPEVMRAQIKDDLVARRAELLEGIARLAATGGKVPSVADEKDYRSHMGETEAILRGELRQTTMALARLANGTYSRYMYCGSPIPLPRLQLIPTALSCGTCIHR
jgi:RNA polymerase-binding transcription factor DksA